MESFLYSISQGNCFQKFREDSYKNAVNQWYQVAKNKTSHSCFTLVGNKKDLDVRVDEN